MKLPTMLIMPILLYGCATQETTQGIPEFETASQEQCATDCELIHAGSVRACSQTLSVSDRTGATVSRCVDDAYATLRSCYRGC